MRRYLSRLLGRRDPEHRPATRLSEGEAVAIAAAVIGRTDLGVHDVTRDDDRLVWTIGTRTRGVNEWVRIADDTGEVTERRRAGTR